MQTQTETNKKKSDLHEAVKALESISTELNNRFPERGEFINTILNALIAKQHVLAVGHPGVGKSAVINLLAGAVVKNKSSFKTWTYQFSKFTTPDEVFGPLSIKAFEQDKVKRNHANMLPEADLAVFEEVFKSNSATLNSCLSALNERTVFQEGVAQKIPLRSALMNSNELPSPKDGLGAVIDRIPQKIWVDRVNLRQSFEAIMFSKKDTSDLKVKISVEQLDLINDAAKAFEFSRTAKDSLFEMRSHVAQLGVYVSDRRIEAGCQICKIQALRFGRHLETVETEDLSVFSNIFWNQVSEKDAVEKIVTRHSQPWKEDIDDANQLLSDAFSELAAIKKRTAKTEDAVKVVQKVDMVEASLKEILKEYPSSAQSVQQATKVCKALKREVQKIVMPWLE